MQTGFRTFLTVILIGLLCGTAEAQSLWRVDFRDKENSPWSLSRPLEFLSERALERRAALGIAVEEADLPVNPHYTDSVVRLGAVAVNSSRWMNSLTVYLPNDSLSLTIAALPFVAGMECTRPDTVVTKSATSKFGTPGELNPIDTSFYGASVYQVGQLNGQYLHSRGFTGKGILIAILDAGFYRVNTLPAFDSLRAAGRIAGTANMVYPPSDIYGEHTHGMMVLSTMGGNKPGRLIGTAPHASYWLIRTEDARSEFPVEEDNWIAGAELADSAGCDIINSSLGYSTYDAPAMSHTFAVMDGKTTRVARGANLAAARGILVFSSAGNEANNSWKRILTPADGDSVIAVAAVNKEGMRASFSSLGPSADNEVKPTLAAMGVAATVEGANGEVSANNGTSFSSPILAGMAACLWQAFPEAAPWHIRHALIHSASQHLAPDSLLGYGIPNMEAAGILLQTSVPRIPLPISQWTLYPLPFRESLTLVPPVNQKGAVTAEFFTLTGQKIFHSRLEGSGPRLITGLGHLPQGIYLVRISSNTGSEVHKIAGGGPR